MIPSWETLFSLQGWCTRYEDVGNDTSNFTTTITTPTLLSYSTLSLSSLSILTAIAPSEPGLARTRMSPFWILLELRMMEVVLTTGTVRRAKRQSNRHQQQTNTQHFDRPDALPVTQPRVSRALRGKILSDGKKSHINSRTGAYTHTYTKICSNINIIKYINLINHLKLWLLKLNLSSELNITLLQPITNQWMNCHALVVSDLH